MSFHAGAAFYDLEDVATDGSAVHGCVEIKFQVPHAIDATFRTSSPRPSTQVAFSQFEGKVCFAQNVASA